jgi:DNA-binding GntR family transcriptional regulator
MSLASTQWGSYVRIAETLRPRLTLLAPGSPVPSETVLSGEFGVARNTVRWALGRLADEGLVATVPGRGRVVLAPGDPVPSEAALTREYGVSRGTVRQTLSLLASLGLVQAVHGKGWFVHAATSPHGG